MFKLNIMQVDHISHDMHINSIFLIKIYLNVRLKSKIKQGFLFHHYFDTLIVILDAYNHDWTFTEIFTYVSLWLRPAFLYAYNEFIQFSAQLRHTNISYDFSDILHNYFL